MATPAPATTQQQPSRWQQFEQAVKLLPALVVAIYVLGFLVVASHHGAYGILAFDLIRSRIITAGCLFVGLTAFPVTLFALNAFYCRKIFNRLWSQLVANAVLSLCFWSVLLLVSRRWGGSDIGESSGPIWALCVTGFIVLYLTLEAVGPRSFPDYRELRRFLPSYATAIVILIAPAFGTKVYPAWSPWIGGGKPQSVVVHVSKAIPFCKDDCNAFLIDETDKGFYLIHKQDDKKASYIPRESIGSIDFLEIPKTAR